MKKLTATLALLFMFSAWADRYKAPSFSWSDLSPNEKAKPQPQEWDSNYKVQEKFIPERHLASEEEEGVTRDPSSEDKMKKEVEKKYPVARPWRLEPKERDY